MRSLISQMWYRKTSKRRYSDWCPYVSMRVFLLGTKIVSHPYRYIVPGEVDANEIISLKVIENSTRTSAVKWINNRKKWRTPKDWTYRLPQIPNSLNRKKAKSSGPTRRSNPTKTSTYPSRDFTAEDTTVWFKHDEKTIALHHDGVSPVGALRWHY